MINTQLHGKTALVTGANSGLGKATAAGLAKMGASVVMLCRSKERGEAAWREIMAASGSLAVELLLADLSSQQSIRQFAADFLAGHERLDILVNNAGVSLSRRVLTVDGIESSLAINHLAAFLLTHLLLDTLKASAPARIVNVGTRLNTAMDLADLQFEKRPYSVMQAYGQTKLGSIHFTYELARRLEGTGVTVNCVHPGVFRSNLGSGEDEPFYLRAASLIARLVLPDAEKAAARVLYLAAAPEVQGVSGKYFGDRVELQSPPQTHDAAARQRLWEISAKLTGLAV